jgi:hypothetical protein
MADVGEDVATVVPAAGAAAGAAAAGSDGKLEAGPPGTGAAVDDVVLGVAGVTAAATDLAP